jgi:hypothetical protein
MNTLQRTITIGSDISNIIRDRFATRLDEPTHPNSPEQNSELDEGQESTHPVWNGDLDEPIWW